MSITPIFLTGFEHGVLSANGGGLWNTVSGSATLDSTIKRTGNYSLKFDTSSTGYVEKTISTTDYIVGRIYVYYDSSTNTWTRYLLSHDGSNYFELGQGDSGGTRYLFVKVNPGSQVFASEVLTEDEWHCIEFIMDCSGATSTIDWKYDGVAQTQATGSTPGSGFTYIRIGNPWSTTTTVFYVDDCIFSVTPSDYPIGEGQIIGLSPNGAGTSSPGSVIKDNGDTVVNDSTNPANVELDDVPLSGGTDYIKQTGTGSYYAEVAFDDLPSASQINGARAIVAYESSDVTANNGETRVYDNDSQETVIYDGDMSETSRFYKSAQVTEPSGGWTQAQANALKARVGYSDNVASIPYWQSLMIEVDYVPSGGEPNEIIKIIGFPYPGL